MNEDVEALHRFCVESLSGYIDEARKTCSMLQGIESFPVGNDVRDNVLHQRIAENDAHEFYQIARTNFFNALKWKDAGG